MAGIQNPETLIDIKNIKLVQNPEDTPGKDKKESKIRTIKGRTAGLKKLRQIQIIKKTLYPKPLSEITNTKLVPNYSANPAEGLNDRPTEFLEIKLKGV